MIKQFMELLRSIPQIAEHPRKDAPISGDMAKFGKEIRFFNGVAWEVWDPDVPPPHK